MPLTPSQRATIQNLYNAIVGPLKLKYGETLIVENVRFQVNETGEVIGLLVDINALQPPDPDGDQVRAVKRVDLW